METNPRIQGEWAPPPPVATPPPPPPLKPTPTTEEEFDGLLGNLVEHYSALPPPSFGDTPVTEEKTEISVRVGPPAWVWAVASVALVGIAGAALFLTGVVNLQMLGLDGEATKTTAAAPAPSVEDTAKAVKIRVAPPPKVEPLPTTEPLADATEPASPAPETKKEVANKPPAAAVKVKVKAKPRGKRVKRNTRRQPKRRVASRRKAPRKVVADDWTDPYQ